LNRKIEEL